MWDGWLHHFGFRLIQNTAIKKGRHFVNKKGRHFEKTTNILVAILRKITSFEEGPPFWMASYKKAAIF